MSRAPDGAGSGIPVGAMGGTTSVMLEKVERALGRLAQRRPVFHSEADLQLALAWQLQLADTDMRIRLEHRMATTPRVELDLLLELGGRRLAVELKYPRAALSMELDDEAYDLRLGAADVESYAVIKDIWRLERLVLEGLADEGCVIVVSNNRVLWQPGTPGREALWDAFRLTDGTTLAGRREWRPTDKKWPGEPIELSGRYELVWRAFATVEAGVGAREFRYLILHVADGDAQNEARPEVTTASVDVRTVAPIPEAEPAGAASTMSTAQRGRERAKRALEDAGFSVREDETRRNRLLAERAGRLLTVWVATRKGFNYPFWAKTDWQPSDDTYACLVRLDEPTGTAESISSRPLHGTRRTRCSCHATTSEKRRRPNGA
jgi:hypothetical protein